MILSKPIRVTWKKSISELSPEHNVFIKGLHERVTEQELERAFGLCGPIFSSKISRDAQAKSRGYGYVQFETEAGAAKALSSEPPVFYGQPASVQGFQKKSQRPEHNENNLYLKNLRPAQNLSELLRR